MRLGFSLQNLISRLAIGFSDLEKGNVTTGAKKKNTPVDKLIVRDITTAHTIDIYIISSS